MSEYDRHIVPLSMIGMLMNYIGNHLLSYIYNQYNAKVFHHGHKVVSIQILANGEILTTAIK
jgi:hypothetical protein